MSMSEKIKKASVLGAAALALTLAVLPTTSAEARWRHSHRGAYVGAGVLGGALLGGALLAPRAYGGPAYYAAPAPEFVDDTECYIVRERVWDEYRGRWMRVKRRVCE